MHIPIQLDQWGLIQFGSNEGWFVKVEDDSKGETGGYYVLIQTGTEPNEGYDAWVETWADVEQYFEEAKWLINWSVSLNSA